MHATLQKVIPEDKREAIDYFENSQFDKHEDVYLKTLDFMAECLETTEPKATSTQSSNQAHSNGISAFSLSHLPPIKIPPFSGNYDEWETFRDRFKSLIIENQDLSAFARMHFLSSSLTGRALDSIKNIQITADNFDIAWKALVSRFENKRRLIEVHVAALCNLPNVSRESAVDLNEMRDKANRSIASLKNLERSSEEILSDILVYAVSQKLDNATRKAWKLKCGDDSSIPKYDDLDRFLASRARALEELNPSNAINVTRAQRVTSATASVSITCPLCKASHFINKCPKFLKKSPNQRLESIKQANRCVNCLSAKHPVSSCPSKYSCRTCQQKHHSMLHIDSVSSSSDKTTTTANSLSTATVPTAVTVLCSTSKIVSRPSILLATARVTVGSPEGRTTGVRALLDQGSEMTLISARLAQNLKLRRLRMPISISAVGCVNAGVSRYAAVIKISPFNESRPVLTTTASILKSLTSYFPSRTATSISLNCYSDLTLADPDPFSSEPVDIIIGADLYCELLLDGIRRGGSGQPTAQNTILGWILSGPTAIPSSPRRLITVQHCASSLSLDRELCQFWELEEIPRQTLLTPEEQQCEEHFVATHSRCADGRYVVRIPFKGIPPIEIGESHAIAQRSMHQLHRRLKLNSALKAEYAAFLAEYERLGHMRKVTTRPASAQCVYIPHHPVIRDSSVTTHLRVVFNASCSTTNTTSLNDHMLIGPKLQAYLASVILRWRQFRYVYSADITKMYRQILVDNRDIDYQRILWSENDTENLQAYQLLTVTYGTASAPFLALRVLRQLINDDGDTLPLAAQVLKNNIYVDDVLFGTDDIPLLCQIRDQVCELLGRGKFELRKWSSNAVKLLEDLAVENHGLACTKVLQTDEQLKILGINWNPSLDVFQFSTALPDVRPNTKRSILSTIAKIFDPLGWSTPVTVVAKIFLQQLWLQKLEWDDILPSNLNKQWESIQSSLAGLNNLKIDRWIRQGSDTLHCELHGFSDASTTAYAAAVYIRLVSISGQITSMLLASKSKVAPVKSISIPRLELAAAVLLTQLIEFVRTSLHANTIPCHCWTDSTVVLAWIRDHPSRWKTFVSNRVSEIQSRLPSATWRKVSTEENPADCASRGLTGSQLSTHHLWWTGPSWLRLSESDWPPQADTRSTDLSGEERFRVIAHLTQPREPWDLASRYSSWPKLVRVTAYLFKFINQLRSAKAHAVLANTSSALTVDDCNIARNFCLKRIQEETFSQERTALLQHKPLSTKSALVSLKLNPYIGEDQLIRVGGRLHHAPIPMPVKHPVILPSHPLVILIVRQAHLRSLHAGTQLTLATLRRDYWILRARSLVKSVIHNCVICTREKAATATQLMGQLPQIRVTPPARAFLHCGVDYARPMLIRSIPGRGRITRKAYIAVFICMAIRAIHLEVVDGYSTAAFLGAYSRFCARRGMPESMYSDNGTTFIGADRELTTAFRTASRDPSFLNLAASQGVAWHFIPPAAPHFGGLWEAGVRSVKHHLRRVIGAHTLTFEEFTTLLCNIEACLNSRPLAPPNDALDDYEPITPGHFLIGSALTAIPEPSLLNIKENRLSRWQLVKQFTERFWKLWQNDYINTLQQRVTWRKKASRPIKVGQLVLIKNPLLPPSKWNLARVTQCHEGPDGLVRVATIKTALSKYRRPIVKLCPLPIDIEQTESMN